MRYVKTFKQFVAESINEAEINSDKEFEEYAMTVLQKAFGNEFDEAKAKETIDGIMKKFKDDYGAMVGALTSGLGESITEAKLSPLKQKELDALIDEFTRATDPDNEYIDGGWDRYRDENEILRDIEKKFGKTIASQVSAISHYPRHDIYRDKLAFKQQWYGDPKRITKKGKMHKQDIQKMKNYYKRGY